MLVAAGRADSLPLDLAAVAVFLVLAAGAIRSIVRGFRSTDDLDARFGDQQVRARTSIEANHVVPSLGRLLAGTVEDLPGWVITGTTVGELERLMQDELAGADYVQQLRQLARLANDHQNVDLFFQRADKWGLIQGFGGGGLLLGLVPWGAWFGFSAWHAPAWLLWLASILVVGSVVVLVVAWSMDTMYRRRLVRLCRRYNQ